MGYILPAKVRDFLEKAWTFYYIPQNPSTHAQTYTNILPTNHLQGVRLPSSLTWNPGMEPLSAHIVRLTPFVDSIGFVLNPAQAGFVRVIEGGAAIPHGEHTQHHSVKVPLPRRHSWEASQPGHVLAGCSPSGQGSQDPAHINDGSCV